MRRRRKAPNSLASVLYVRAPQALLDGLDVLVAAERAKHPGRTVSRSDMAREILYSATREAAQ